MLKLWNVHAGEYYDYSDYGYVAAETRGEALFEARKLVCEELTHDTVRDLRRIVSEIEVSEVSVNGYSLNLAPNGEKREPKLRPIVLVCFKIGDTAMFETDFDSCEGCLCCLCGNKGTCARNRCSYCRSVRPNVVISCKDDGKDILTIEDDEP